MLSRAFQKSSKGVCGDTSRPGSLSPTEIYVAGKRKACTTVCWNVGGVYGIARTGCACPYGITVLIVQKRYTHVCQRRERPSMASRQMTTREQRKRRTSRRSNKRIKPLLYNQTGNSVGRGACLRPLYVINPTHAPTNGCARSCLSRNIISVGEREAPRLRAAALNNPASVHQTIKGVGPRHMVQPLLF